jgi:Ca-activated chloride channel family protein
MDFAHPHFAEPLWLWLAWTGPLAFLLLFLYGTWARRRQWARFLVDPSSSHPASLASSHSPRRRVVKNLMLVLAIGGIGLAMARPQWGEQTEMAQSLGDDLLFILDCSRSMLAADVRPNRLTRAKLAIIDFVERHGRGRVGLVAFAGQAFLQCPLTYDYDAFREALMSVDDRTIPVPGTDVGRALDEAFLAMEKNDRRKIVVLLSDGEDLEKLGVSTARKLVAEGVVAFAVGVGTTAGSTIHVPTAQGPIEELRDAKGNVVRSRLDEETLRAIADATGGRYQPLGTVGEGMRKILFAVNRDPDLRNVKPQRKLGVDRFHVPVALVLLLLVTESLIGTRKRSVPPAAVPPPGSGTPHEPVLSRWRAELLRRLRNAWAKRWARGSSTLQKIQSMSPMRCRPAIGRLGLLLSLILALTGQTYAREDPDRSPASARVLYEQGVQALQAGKWEEAEAALLEAVARQDAGVQPPALYNLGHVRFAHGQQALKKGPDFSAIQNQARAALDLGARAVKDAEAALAARRIEAIVTAYRQARPARRQLKGVTEQVRDALELYRTVLLRWDRASGDFKSAFELDPDEDDARFNAVAVDLRIARLVEQARQIQQNLESLAGLQQQLQQQMNAMRKQLPKQEQEDGDDEEEEQSEEPRQGQQEKLPREGREKLMTREEAARLLESLKLDANRKLPMGFERTDTLNNRPGRTW